MSTRQIKQKGLSLFIGCFGLMACLPPPPVPRVTDKNGAPVAFLGAPSESDEHAAAALNREITRLRISNPTRAVEKEEALLKRYPATEASARLLYERGESARALGAFAEAKEHFARLLLYRPQFEKTTEVRILYGKLCLELGHDEEAMNTFRFLYANAELDSAINKLAPLFAQSLVNTDHHDQALELMVDRRNNGSLGMNERAEAEESATAIASGPLSFAQTKRLWDRHGSQKSWEFVQPAIAFRLAKIYYHIRDYERAEEILQLFSTRYPTSQYGRRARSFYERLRDRFEIDPQTIGILLPLSGRYKVYGERSLAAMKLAFGDDSRFTLAVRDTAGDPTIAASAVEDLVLEDHAIAIIGPLFSKSAYAAALKAEELSIPLIALSHREGLPEVGSYVFRTALTVKAQAEALARTAFETLEFKTFAILFPRSGYGTSFAHAFWDEVTERGGEVRGFESYEHDQTTFREPVQKLVGRWYRQSRPDYLLLKEEIEALELSPHKTQSRLGKLKKNLPPIVDFDAIVIPDSGRNIGLIAPALAFEDIVMTHNPKTLEKIRKATGNEDIHPVTLLGASTWNSPRILKGCDRYCENAVFVDGYYSDNPLPKVRDFVASFTEATQAKPRLNDAQAYDTADFLRWVLESTNPATREELQQGLLNTTRFQGVTGSFKFSEDGEADRVLYTLTIADKSIQLYKRPQG